MIWLAHLNARLSAIVLVIARLCLAGLGIVVLYGVVMRYVFNNEPPYVEQLALLLVISVSMFGAATVAHDAGHIGLDSLVNRLPPTARHWIARLVALQLPDGAVHARQPDPHAGHLRSVALPAADHRRRADRAVLDRPHVAPRAATRRRVNLTPWH
jgi:hypothetical protein